ncbi:hypothetical protein [Krasilnikoviella flava]|uniref:hypothetical protein n=1 Tax=Krasilnikoviella flava TaxID=526729 RepID=UPI00111C5084|nr:hypothetical protein [Krasilnikoviella flava]
MPPTSPAAGVRRVASAYQRPTVVDPWADVPLQQVTAPAAAAPPPRPEPAAAAPTTPPAGAATVHAPVPPPPEPAVAAQPTYPPAHQATQQIPPTPAYSPQAAPYPPAYSAQPAYAAQPAPVPPAAATQVQQPVHAQQATATHAPAGYAAPAAAPPPAPPRRRRRLSAGWIAFIAVDVVLIAMAVVFAVQIFSSSSPDAPAADAGTVASPTPSASASAQEPMQGEVLAHFAAPSKNIACSIYADGASCGIAQLNQQPAPTEGCDGTTGYAVTVDAEGTVAQPCVPANEQPEAAGDDVDVLDYGDSITEGDYTCTSEETGMSCTHDPTGKGFSLARAGIGTS